MLLEWTGKFARVMAELLRLPERRATVVSVMCLLLLCQPHPPATFLQFLDAALPVIHLLKEEAARTPGATGPTSATEALYGLSM